MNHHCRAQLACIRKNAHKKKCSRVQIVQPYRLHCPFRDMSLLQRMNHIFNLIDSLLFKRKQEVLLSFTHGKHHCTAQSAFIIRSLHCLPRLPCPLPVLPGHTLSMYITWCSTNPFGKSVQPGLSPPLCCSLYSWCAWD